MMRERERERDWKRKIGQGSGLLGGFCTKSKTRGLIIKQKSFIFQENNWMTQLIMIQKTYDKCFYRTKYMQDK